jgi:NAD(P)-dependent dehydrogenase (short-subunit alcohol dehydrogenase family)
MIGLTESLAWEVGNYGIRVMAICPGEVDSKIDPGYIETTNTGCLSQKNGCGENS